MSEYTTEERLQMLNDLKGVKCYCGARKAKMQTFCRQHYSSLPPQMRSVLYQRFGEGYEEAYTKALAWLKERAHPAVTRVE